MEVNFDVVVVGTGFASSFFLHRYLRDARASVRVLVLEAGERKSHAQLLAEGLQKDRDQILEEAGRHFVNRTPDKWWAFTVAFGGGSNCWWGNTPRMLPADFELRTRYGVGEDWPFSYASLETFYCEAEEIMGISGPAGETLTPRSRPYPQPPHRMSLPDRHLAEAFEGLFYPISTARARVATEGRGSCCANSVCRLCPVDAKFTILNGMPRLYEDPRIELRFGARVTAVEAAAGVVRSVRYRRGFIEHTVQADLVVLGANALFNPHILLASGLSEGGVGEGLVEQVSRSATIYLDGLDNFQGSTSHTGHGYMFYDGAHRRTRAAALVETSNAPHLRQTPGKWRQRLEVKVICEDLRQPQNLVRVPREGAKPETVFTAHSTYAMRTLDEVESYVTTLADALPVERIKVGPVNPSEAHIMGTTAMGTDPRTSVVDDSCIHHRLRNLIVLGSGTFPTAAPANPTLTIAAVSLRSAARLQRSEGGV